MGLARLLIPRLIGSQAPRSLRLIHRLVMSGIAVAVAMLLVTIAIMQGFWGSYVAAAREFHGDMVVVQQPEGEVAQPFLEILRNDTATAKITAETPFVMREGLLTGGGSVAGVVIKAIDWPTYIQVHSALKITWTGEGDSSFTKHEGPLPVILGKSLVGEQLPTRLFIPTPDHPEGESIPIRVVGSFESGLYDYDHQFIFVPHDAFATLLHLPENEVSGIELRLKDPSRTWSATHTWQDRFPEATITNWGELNHNMFDALRLQRTTFVVLMSLFVIIAIANVVSVVGLQVYFRRQEGAILRLLGLPLYRLRRLIWAASSWTALLGVALGTVLGLATIMLLAKTTAITLPESVYFVSALPVHLDWPWVAIVIGGVLLVSTMVVGLAVHRMAKIPILKGLVRS